MLADDYVDMHWGGRANTRCRADVAIRYGLSPTLEPTFGDKTGARTEE